MENPASQKPTDGAAAGPPSEGALNAALAAFSTRPGSAAPRLDWSRIHPVRAVVTVAVLIGSLLLLWPTRDELLYHIVKQEPLDVPDATALRSGAALPLGRFVRLHGVLGNRAAEIPAWRQGTLRFGPINVRQVLGSPVFVEFSTRTHGAFQSFTEVEVDGRITDFGPRTELLAVRDFIARQGIEVPDDARLLIVDERPGEMSTYVTAWTFGLALNIWLWLGIARRLRRT